MVLPNKPFEDRTNIPGYNPDGINPQHRAVGLAQQLSGKTIGETKDLLQRIAEAISADPSMDVEDAKHIHLDVYQSYVTVHGSVLDEQAEAILAIIEKICPGCVPDIDMSDRSVFAR